MTTRKEALTDLLAKVEAGKVQDWKCFMKALGLHPDDRTRLAGLTYNGSLDAAKALHEAVLPGWGYAVSPQYARVVDPIPLYGHPDKSKDAINTNNPARAWLIAILKALIAQETEV